MDILNKIKFLYKSGDIVIRLIFINVAVFLVVNILDLFTFLFTGSAVGHFSLINWLAVPADLHVLIYKPWTVFTYMFLHYGFLHILFNMLWLFWFGKIFLEFLSSKQLLSVYLLGGLSGAFLYILAYNVLPAFASVVQGSVALGASASIYAVVVAISAYTPNYTINLMFIGRIKIKYIAIFVIVLDILSIPSSNAGGHIAHLGGAAFGYIFALQFKKGSDISRGFTRFTEGLFEWFKPKPKMHVSSNKSNKKQSSSDIEYNKSKNASQEEIDHILEKISKNGYDSLSKKEKETLFKMSNKK